MARWAPPRGQWWYRQRMSRPSLRHVVGNFMRSELALAERIALTVKNNAIKVKNRSDCCGNHGEPGC